MSLPSGWATVSYDGIAFGVPRSWPVHPFEGRYHCFFPGPGVLIETIQSLTSHYTPCGRPSYPRDLLRATVVTVCGPCQPADLGPTKREQINDLTVIVSSEIVNTSSLTAGTSVPPFGSIFLARIPSRNVSLHIRSVGNNPSDIFDRAKQIVATVHAA